MKTRFNTFDIVCCIAELQKLVGMRVNNIYDVDNKTYLIKFQSPEQKQVLLLESGNRFHTTGYEWPKHVAPSGFSMKLRKHLKNKRLESLTQLGTDRIVDFQFGSGEAAYHIILELYDRGNIVLCDYELTILNILRPHTEGEKVKFAVREKYPQNRARETTLPKIEDIKAILEAAKDGDTLKKILIPNLDYGPSLIEHVLLKHNFSGNSKKGKGFNVEESIVKIHEAILEADELLNNAKHTPCKGWIIQKKEERPQTNGETTYFYTNEEFHPLFFLQHKEKPFIEYESFNQAVDEFFSTLQGQKIDLKALQQEREAIKKLENVKKDHNHRLEALEKTQENDKVKAELITKNLPMVESAILAMQNVLASQVSWNDIEDLLKEAASKGDVIAKQIKALKLSTNHITMLLSDPYHEDATTPVPTLLVDIDLGLSAFANARRYYDQKRTAAKKQQKTIESSSKALKSAEKKTKQVLKEVQTTTNINKARKVFWFEKFFWFISSENYLVIAGRDQQQNELLVKRYMKPNDIYVHADLHGASSVVIKNPSGKPVPPKTLNEAGTMAICYSVAWEAKVLTNAYWVSSEQVSKTAPTGEYLTTGSFMIRGKKNYLPPSQLILGLGFLFRLEEGSVERHKGERKVVAIEELELDHVESVGEERTNENEEEIVVSEGSEDEHQGDEDERELKDIKEEDVEGEEDSTKKDLTNEEDSTIEDSESDDSSKFPDIQITIDNYTKQISRNDQVDPILPNLNQLELNERVEMLQRRRTASEASNKSKSSISNKPVTQERSKKEEQQQPKRGQKSKQRKIKEKYKDQDDEERALRLQILQSSGTSKKSKKSSKKSDTHSQPKHQIPKQPRLPKSEPFEEDEVTVQADVDMIDFLTGIPVTEDELLFAVPVVAPYNTLSQYKFKIKMTPGTAKRGKAAKTAVAVFVHDKTTTQRERDLLKAVKDDILARNLPGKVKLSAPKMQKGRVK